MFLSRRTEQRLLAAARRVSGDHSLDDLERYRVRPWVGYGLGIVATASIVVGIVTGTGWLAFVFLAAMVIAWFADRHVTVAAGPSSAFVFRDSVWGPSIGPDVEQLRPGDVERISARRWRIAGRDVWVWSPTRPLLERLLVAA